MQRFDCSIGEGGGQVLRTILAYSTLLQKPVSIFNIRAKRDPPGLRMQHLRAAQTIAKISGTNLNKIKIGSTKFEFNPQKISGGHFHIDIKTAGSITLLLQAILPIMTFAPDPFSARIIGGTDVRWSPPIDTLNFVLTPILNQMGLKCELRLNNRGYYPRGGGTVDVKIIPIKELKPIRLVDQGEIEGISGISHARGLPKHVAERQADSAMKTLKQAGLPIDEIRIDIASDHQHDRTGPGSGIVLWAKTSTNAILQGNALGEKGIPAEEVGKRAAMQLVTEIHSNAPVDRFIGDNLIIWMALAKGLSKIRVSKITTHTRTAIKIAEQFLGKIFTLTHLDQKRSKEVNGGQSGIIACNGVGFKSSKKK